MSPAPHPLEPDEHRRARHHFVLKALTDRGVALAHKAADKAEAQLDAPDPSPEEPPAPAAPDHHRTFERYARLVRLLVTAEHRIATIGTPTRRHYRVPAAATPDADPRRPQLRQFIHDATKNSPDRAQLRHDADLSVDEALGSDPARTLPAAIFLHDICQIYGLPFDLSKLPDEFLDTPITGPP